MYASQQLRYRAIIDDITGLLAAMALDPRGFPGILAEAGLLKSSASSPSLRSRDSEIVLIGRSTPDNGGGNVRVVVRVRGFLPREVARGAECLVEMNPITQATKLLIPNTTDPANSRTQSRKVVEEKNFTFDNSFWSHDPADEHYANQEDIYNALGEEFLDHNFEGYHTCIFAYGQTGSGKSYTMMGTPTQPGLIPRTCEDLFQRIESNTSPHISYTVRVSYFEVYNEHVRDLLSPTRPSPDAQHPYYLKIRESPTEGPYVKDLTDLPVKNYAELLRYMRMGDNSRTTASTKMNDTSSRSHAVFTIMLKQIHHDLSTDATTERLARIRLVDLAGSERAKATEATGARLREGSNINKSLTTLGRVIAALADPRHGRINNGSKGRSKDVVPYRDSILTWLLKDSLGGNSKTAMIACIAPSDYDETLSTLRYADQAKHIRTRAIVNQDSVSAAERDAQIAEMQNTIRQLQVQVSLANQQASERSHNNNNNNNNKGKLDGGAGAGIPAARDEKLEEYQLKVERMQRLMEEERLVGESRVRQLMEQNDALRLHLKLAVESLKNPIPAVSARGGRGGEPECQFW
ncbi:MAG: kinesin family [Lasallia pustulata]|uniref:Kinesin-like protein n=1 Tax=Lasallia pustulata TaxID=136370 RepID=A0A5M8PGV3_9LECA|nr:MAG: kinesin family [Lasallia pustulata]